ncbi:unnamed protein product [Rotaria magnacalcarata]|uniref:Uncharacterized protein n=2 Tax=Rotaria magnacalcarata TaxID=392030 RepID=A0A816VG36_9BILA|nr:unnamed protein product [Rotaria magnacalcarata]CAF1561755.1 unnamed protein product [Rotaria magnacalcarata]CAF2092963.1 unnamed protein product [Rotaria magnacalcarata]CAF2120551.1 unnamed protein product [Rotaria magnacalcarata]CAF2226794.1 unnamed protein product [Rotaria magnacalcarata]
MNNLFDNAEKIIKFNRIVSQQLQIKNVLNPYTQTFIDAQLANTLGILSNGYYRNCSNDLIPIHTATSEGLVEFTINDQTDCEEMIVEYHSKYYPVITQLFIRQVYDSINQCMVTYRQAIDSDYLDIELFIYSCSNISMSIHEAFYCGFIVGELRTDTTERKLPKTILQITENEDAIFSLLKTIVNSLREFTNTILIHGECELTSDGYIQLKTTQKSYLLTEAIELGLVSFENTSQITQSEPSNENSIQSKRDTPHI